MKKIFSFFVLFLIFSTQESPSSLLLPQIYILAPGNKIMQALGNIIIKYYLILVSVKRAPN
ncbi:hypothetical protein BAZSYMA_ACONTIG61458_0 [Bathymodiolus azoricus thioautotrophic gill symbiont]|uniref:Uncharacterized protein n=1 Tax=Bathymodiolus azoricus thioautotrophic gill symbiont TaxID=235205 RepID=A0A1H6JKJ9_9GAMM|nr:hypothetical protein BAZSYMA_ACONTIG61458_0 [Bathymodiolus azoricus thioautotrophic gill symbiont]